MSRISVSTRTAFILACVVTIILIAGSAILSRIVFKAATSSATVYFNPSAPVVKTGEVTDVDVLTNFGAAAELVGAQLSVKYDPQLLSYVDVVPATNWQVIKATPESGQLEVIELPISQTSQSLRAGQPVALATLRFRAVAAGQSTLSFDPASTIIATTDSSLGHSIDNSLASVQDAQVSTGTLSLADQAANAQVRLDAASQTASGSVASQRIAGDQALLAPETALILVSLQQPARLTVRFGPTKALSNTVSYATLAAQAAVKINGLKPGERYYYQVVAGTSDGASQTLGQLKSFQLPLVSTQTTVDHASLTIFPAQTDVATNAYALFYDADGKIITGLEPKFSADNSAVGFGSLSEQTGLYQAPLNATATSKAIVSAKLTLGDQELASASVLIDPNLNTAPSPTVLSAVTIDQKTINLLLALVGALLVFGLAFLKLSRAR